jgi:creatinine amidohydrolase
MERMFPDELERAMGACPVVYLPYGLCEPHGPQNAVGLDALKAHAICRAAAIAHGGLVAPPDYWHVHEVGLYASWAAPRIGAARPWLTAMPPWMHFKNVCYHVRAMDALGFEAAILLTGHYGPNWKDLKTVLGILQPHLAMRMYGLPDFEANEPGFDGRGGDHAGKVETSLLWALEPESVDVSRFPAEDDPGPHFAMGEDARESDRRVGERMVADEVAWLGGKAAELRAQYAEHRRERRRPVTFAELEAIWTREIEPRVPAFASMQPGPGEPPPRDSQWWANYEARPPGEGGEA